MEISIKTTQRSEILTETIVSTNDQEIADRALAAGGKVPFVRPQNLADDEAPVWQVAQHAAQWYQQNRNRRPDIIVTLQPTSPFRSAEHIDTAVRMLLNNDQADSVIGVAPVEHTPYKMRTIENGFIKDFLPGKTVVQRQEAPEVYRFTGTVFASRWETLMEKDNLWGEYPLAYVQPQEVAFNIDSMFEFEIAEWLYQKQMKEEKNR